MENYRGDNTPPAGESKTESVPETKPSARRTGQYRRNSAIEAATHFAGSNRPERAQTAAEVIDAGMNESAVRAEPISETPPVTKPENESARSRAAIPMGQTASCETKTGNVLRNSARKPSIFNAGATAYPIKKSERTEYA